MSRAPAVGFRTEDMYALHYVRRADEPALGYGLYAARALEAGTVLGEYTGMLFRPIDHAVFCVRVSGRHTVVLICFSFHRL